jgi:hypothetical protein
VSSEPGAIQQAEYVPIGIIGELEVKINQNSLLAVNTSEVASL